MKGSGPPGVCGGDGLRKSQPATVCHRLSSTRPTSSMPSSGQPHSQMGPRLSCRWQALRCPGKDAAGPGWWGRFRGSVVPPGSSVPVASVDRTRPWCRQGQRWVLPAAPGLSPPPRVWVTVTKCGERVLSRRFNATVDSFPGGALHGSRCHLVRRMRKEFTRCDHSVRQAGAPHWPQLPLLILRWVLCEDTCEARVGGQARRSPIRTCSLERGPGPHNMHPFEA